MEREKVKDSGTKSEGKYVQYRKKEKVERRVLGGETEKVQEKREAGFLSSSSLLIYVGPSSLLRSILHHHPST